MIGDNWTANDLIRAVLNASRPMTDEHGRETGWLESVAFSPEWVRAANRILAEKKEPR